MAIYVNRILNLKNIKLIGFDMDYTLVRYDCEAFEQMAFYEVLNKLVKLKNYPEQILQFKFDYNKVIRGLVFDKVRGNLLKLSRYGEVKTGVHGLTPLLFDVMRKTYRGLHIDVSQPQYYSLDTTFAVSTGLLFSLLVDLKDSGCHDHFPTGYTYTDIFSDLEEMLNISHVDESLKGQVRQNISKFIIPDENVVRILEKFKDSGKTLAIITNSDYSYTRLLLDYTINPYLPEGQTWSTLFDYVITLSDKPRFFMEKARFLKVDRDTGYMSNCSRMSEKGIYQGGCARDLQTQLDLKGDQILYLGDHIYGDIVTLKKSCDWKTGLVIDDLTREIDSLRNGEKCQQAIDKLMSEKEILERQMSRATDENAKEIFSKIKKLDEEISEKLVKYQEFFNPIWGPMMRAGQEESRLANQIERYAYIYMSKIVDFADYSPRHYFRPKRRPLPHETF